MAKEEIRTLITLISMENDDPLSGLLQQLFGKQEVYAEPGSQVLRVAPGVMLQLCGPGAQAPEYLASAHQPVISLPVDDLAAAITAATTRGARLMQEWVDTCTGFSLCHLQLADGRVIGFYQPS